MFGDFIITRASTSNNMLEITYMKPDGEPGLSINVEFSGDYDQNGSAEDILMLATGGWVSCKLGAHAVCAVES